MPDWSLSNTHMFSKRHITTFLNLGLLDSISALCLGAISNSEMTKPPRKCEKLGNKYTMKRDTCLQYESGNKKSPLSCSTWLRMCMSEKSNSSMLCAGPQMTMKEPRALIWRLQVNFSKSASTESVNNEDQLYFKLNYAHLTCNVKITRFYSGQSVLITKRKRAQQNFQGTSLWRLLCIGK